VDVFAIIGFMFGTTAFVMITAMDKRLKALTSEVAELRQRLPESWTNRAPTRADDR
jgi:hypothetical protein